MSQRLVLLSTDAIHHVYFIHRVLQAGFALDAVIYETEAVKAPFPTGPLFEAQQDACEREVYFRDFPEAEPTGLPVFHVPRVNTPEARALIQWLDPGLGVVFGCGRICPETIGLFPQGLLNIHKGFAEEYRGLDTDLWPIYHFEYDRIGVTVHKVEPELDTGAIVREAPVPLRPGMRIHELRPQRVTVATDLVIDALREFGQGRLTSRPQQSRGRYYFFMPLDLKRIVAARFERHCARLS